MDTGKHETSIDLAVSSLICSSIIGLEFLKQKRWIQGSGYTIITQYTISFKDILDVFWLV
jgi:hypothetical protein